MTTQELTFLRYIQEYEDYMNPEEQEVYLDKIKQLMEPFGYEYEIINTGIVIKFPDCLCKDFYGNTTPILEPYVYITTSRNVYIRRQKLTSLQYTNKYIHSHVLADNIKEWTSSICYGDNIIHQRTFFDTLITVLTFYPTFLAEESTMTHPYKTLRNMAHKRDTITRPATIYNLSVFTPYLVTKIETILGLQLLKVSVSDQQGFDQAVIDAGGTCYIVDGQKYRNSGVGEQEEMVISTSFTFKGERLPLIVIPDSEAVEATPLACELTKINILERINDYINEPNFLQQSQTSSDNTGQS